MTISREKWNETVRKEHGSLYYDEIPINKIVRIWKRSADQRANYILIQPYEKEVT